MSADYQSARIALGARLRSLRDEAGLDGKGIEERLGWQRSKVSRLETGKQTPSTEDLRLWAQALGRPDVADELGGRLTGLETRYRLAADRRLRPACVHREHRVPAAPRRGHRGRRAGPAPPPGRPVRAGPLVPDTDLGERPVRAHLPA